MRFATLLIAGADQACIRRMDGRWAPLNQLHPDLEGDLLSLLTNGRRLVEDLMGLQYVADELPPASIVPASEAVFLPPYRHPRKIWGIGLNYRDHATDLHEQIPDQPASFLKGDHTIIGPDDEIVLPHQSNRTTGEAEIGLVIGREGRNIESERALEYVFGVCPILDQTAEDILRLNPRYLTRAKNFPTFFSFGPEVVTLDEFLATRTLAEVGVATVIDGAEIRRNLVGNMTHAPADLVSFHSQMMPFFPGDIISTGTPGAGVLTPGVILEAHVDGLAPLRNPVRAEES